MYNSITIFTTPNMTLCVSSGENKNKMELNLYNSIANFTVPKGDNNLSLSLVRCTSTRVVCPTSIIPILSCVVSALSHIPENRYWIVFFYLIIILWNLWIQISQSFEFLSIQTKKQFKIKNMYIPTPILYHDNQSATIHYWLCSMWWFGQHFYCVNFSYNLLDVPSIFLVMLFKYQTCVDDENNYILNLSCLQIQLARSVYFPWLINIKIPLVFFPADIFLLCMHSDVNVTTVGNRNIMTGFFGLTEW